MTGYLIIGLLRQRKSGRELQDGKCFRSCTSGMLEFGHQFWRSEKNNNHTLAIFVTNSYTSRYSRQNLFSNHDPHWTSLRAWKCDTYWTTV